MPLNATSSTPLRLKVAAAGTLPPQRGHARPIGTGAWPVRFGRSLVLSIVLAVGLGGAAAQEVKTGDLDALRERALELVNEARKENGLSPLTPTTTAPRLMISSATRPRSLSSGVQMPPKS